MAKLAAKTFDNSANRGLGGPLSLSRPADFLQTTLSNRFNGPQRVEAETPTPLSTLLT